MAIYEIEIEVIANREIELPPLPSDSPIGPELIRLFQGMARMMKSVGPNGGGVPAVESDEGMSFRKKFKVKAESFADLAKILSCFDEQAEKISCEHSQW